MAKTILDEVFNLLKQIGAVNSESEFSSDWLCRSECYLRTVRFKGAEPSTSTVAICASKLQHYGTKMIETDTHLKLGRTFLSLSEQCHQHINSRSTLTWLDD
ncbi:hypothetical protein SAMN04487869_1562 [Marinobacter sp. DSM 26671]|uniref:DUF6626 family protein n=1 Tax=Marinobacter sp. DSM 26671 TaxID=1761793 RepID=UPI0008EFC6A8|nr:MAG: hypothetical protein COB05_08570 [Marinobacter sp.]SFF05438.1 hypothetical protein SAMN04487869_1562 [Marinobacter sp. DSM 26671]